MAEAGGGAAEPALALLGPTACGKSALALELAERLGAEIISVDSGAVYRDMVVGTAAPTRAMLAAVRHHLVGVVNPPDAYNVGRFYRDAMAAVADIRARGKLPLFVGGTMMYFNALFAGLSRRPAVAAEVVAAVRREAAAAGGLGRLHAEIARGDAALARGLPVRDAQRIVRTVALLRSGWVPGDGAGEEGAGLKVRRVLLMPGERAVLRERIAARLEGMWKAGLVRETEYLMGYWGLGEDAGALKMVGYRQAVRYLQGEVSEKEMRREAFVATCRLAKRQLTWMRKWEGECAVVEPFGPGDLVGRVVGSSQFPAPS